MRPTPPPCCAEPPNPQSPVTLHLSVMSPQPPAPSCTPQILMEAARSCLHWHSLQTMAVEQRRRRGAGGGEGVAPGRSPSPLPCDECWWHTLGCLHPWPKEGFSIIVWRLMSAPVYHNTTFWRPQSGQDTGFPVYMHPSLEMPPQWFKLSIVYPRCQKGQAPVCPSAQGSGTVEVIMQAQESTQDPAITCSAPPQPSTAARNASSSNQTSRCGDGTHTRLVTRRVVLSIWLPVE